MEANREKTSVVGRVTSRYRFPCKGVGRMKSRRLETRDKSYRNVLRHIIHFIRAL